MHNKNGYTVRSASFFPEPAHFSVAPTQEEEEKKKEKDGGWCTHLVFHHHFWAGTLWMSFNICFGFLSDTINFKRKWAEVVEWSPNKFHGHLQVWK